jgi:hypothetical protein
MWLRASSGLLSHYTSTKIKTVDIVNYTHYQYIITSSVIKGNAGVLEDWDHCHTDGS